MGMRGPQSTEEKANSHRWDKGYPRTIEVRCSKCEHRLTEINWNSEWTSWTCENTECPEWRSPQGGRRISEIPQGACIKCRTSVPVPVYRVVHGERIGPCMYCRSAVNLDAKREVHGDRQ
jgi:hypothetical protein